MNGRILHELLDGGPDPKGVAVTRQTAETENKETHYRLTMSTARVADTDYLDFTKVTRSP
jgi:hypothetical protein